jgi:xylulokinase
MFIGVDVGTSSSKGVVVDGRGKVVASASASHDFLRPRPGWAEQDPAVWWDASRRVLGELTAVVGGANVRAVGLSGQMHGSVFLDRAALDIAGSAEPRAVRNALMWNDQRTSLGCAEIAAAVGGVRRLVELVGNAPLTGFTLPKILWLRRMEPEKFARVAAVCLPKDFVRLCLTGTCATDVGDAAGTLLLDVERRAWSGAVLRAVGLDPALLPPVFESGALAGRVTAWASDATGLAEGTPVVAGSGDNMCGGLGAGVVSPGRAVVTLGTSGVVFAHADRCLKDLDERTPGRVHTMCSATGTAERAGGWTITGCMLSAAGSLEWARGVLGAGARFDELMAEAAPAPAGCEGLLFLPYLTGERCPYPDPAARGGWLGLTRSHTRGHLVRAVLEGVAMNLAKVFDLVESLAPGIAEVRVGGGGARSALWRQILADTLGRDLVAIDVDEGPAHGAALLAAVAGGAFASIEEACDAAVGLSGTTRPGPDAAAMRALRPVFESAYASTAPTMHALSGQ